MVDVEEECKTLLLRHTIDDNCGQLSCCFYKGLIPVVVVVVGNTTVTRDKRVCVREMYGEHPQALREQREIAEREKVTLGPERYMRWCGLQRLQRGRRSPGRFPLK